MRLIVALALVAAAGTAAADMIPVTLQSPSSLATANTYLVDGTWQAYASDYSWYSFSPMLSQSAVEAAAESATLHVLGQAGQEAAPPANYMAMSGASLQGQFDVPATTASPSGTPLVLTLQANVQSSFSPSTVNWSCTVYSGNNALGTMGGSQLQLSVPALAGQTGLRVEIYASNGTADSYYDDAVTVAWTAAPGFVKEDTNHDAAINSLDLDAIFAHLGAGNNQWDFNSDGTVNQADVTGLLHDYFHATLADANLDGKVGFVDMQAIINNWSLGGTWAQADFNGDQKTNFLDFQTLIDFWNPVGIPATPAPEPGTMAVLLAGAVLALRRKGNFKDC